ncbi:metallophosphoesterase [Streptomyces tsukubensis]|uniref:metallophosphoesterase n=1 Tax=Streptomyces tsukubensis TaxID=83656 RepID=UPI0036D12F11
MIVVVLLAVVAVIAVLAAAHWYVWRRLVRDLTTVRKARIAGAVVLTALPLISVAAQFSARSGVPFTVQQVLAWPGFLWLAVLLYLVLFLVAGEVVRFVWLRIAERRDAGTATVATTTTTTTTTTTAAEPATAPVPAAAPEQPAPGPVTTAAAAEAPGAGTLTAEAPPAGSAAPNTADRSAARPGGVSRRMFVSRVVGGGAAAAALGTVGVGTYSVLNGPTLKRVTVPLAKLPRSAHGYRIAVVSDIHLGPILGRAHTQRIVDTINSANPDLIAVVGDMVDGSVADLGPAAEPLTQLRARHGSFFVTGNHEYFSGAEQWVDHVRELGLRPLENERVEIAAGFDLAGVDDPEGEREGKGPDFGRALGDRDRGRTAVLLAHQPVVIHDAVKHGVDLQLSGHSHGGQLWPGEYLAALANPTVEGLERYGDTQLYVTRGAGAWGPPVRVGADSDITVVQLASRQA